MRFPKGALRIAVVAAVVVSVLCLWSLSFARDDSVTVSKLVLKTEQQPPTLYLTPIKTETPHITSAGIPAVSSAPLVPNTALSVFSIQSTTPAQSPIRYGLYYLACNMYVSPTDTTAPPRDYPTAAVFPKSWWTSGVNARDLPPKLERAPRDGWVLRWHTEVEHELVAHFERVQHPSPGHPFWAHAGAASPWLTAVPATQEAAGRNATGLPCGPVTELPCAEWV